nr:unnamed protein product [Callosobruchus analis]
MGKKKKITVVLNAHTRHLANMHLKTHNINSKTIVCHLCDYKTNRTDVLKQHMLFHDRANKKMYTCDKCNYTSVYKSSIKVHSIVHDKTNKPYYICYHCNLKTFAKGTLRKHLLLKHSRIKPKKIKCPSCKKEFSLKNAMDNHILMAHPHLSEDIVTSRVHSCTDCSYKTTLLGNLRSHRLTHSKQGSETFNCNICGYVGYRKSYLKQHMLMHEGIKKYKCIKCKKRFSQDSHLACHILSNHSNSKKLLKTITRSFYTCEYCSYKNIRKTVIESHVSAMHGKKYVH